jgi:hypothetical protein
MQFYSLFVCSIILLTEEGMHDACNLVSKESRGWGWIMSRLGLLNEPEGKLGSARLGWLV